MAEETVTPKNVSDLIDYLMKAKDPAVVGLRRILKKKADTGRDFPLQEHIFEELGTSKHTSGKIFTETEQRIMELEKTVLKLQHQLTGQKKDAEKAIKGAYAKGRQEGFVKGEKASYEKARSEFDQQIRDIQEKLTTVLRDVGESRKALINEAERSVIDIAMIIAQKVINTEISLNPDIILSVIKKALSFIVDRQELVVRVSPDDLETVTEKKDFWTSIAERLDKVTVEPDTRIERGGCIIESKTGVADARVAVQLKEVLEVIDATWENVMTSQTAADEIEAQRNEPENAENPEDEPENHSEVNPDANAEMMAGEAEIDSGNEGIEPPADREESSDNPVPPEGDIQENPGIPE